MKWQKPPIWPVAKPAIAGFICGILATMAAVDFARVGLPYLRMGWLLMFFLAFGFARMRDKNDASEPKYGDQLGGIMTVLVLGYWPQLLISVWFVIVIAIWMWQSTYLWKRDFPPFRLGMWLGYGLMSGFWVASILAALLLL